MQKTLLVALAAATLISGGTLYSRVAAMTFAAPPAPVAASPDAAVTPVAIVCGNTGCVPVQTKRVQKPKPLNTHH